MPRTTSSVAAVLVALAIPAAAIAAHGGGGPGPGRSGGPTTEVRAGATCGKGASARLRLRQHDGRIEVEFDVQNDRTSAVWQLVVVQEGRVVWRGRAPNPAPGGSLSAHHTISSLTGADRITTRATGPRGITCVASAILPG